MVSRKRKIREVEDFVYKNKNQKQYTNILIVCEDKKSAPNYLNALIYDLGLNSRRIKAVPCPCGTDPVSIVGYSLKKIDDNPGIYDYVLCVFDGTGNDNLNKALNDIDEANNKGISIKAIISYPCFEYWLLMHYSTSAKPYNKDSDMVKDLKKYIPQYDKGILGIYDLTKDRIDDAIKNSKSTLSQAKSIENPNPSTTMHELIELLREISEKET